MIKINCMIKNRNKLVPENIEKNFKDIDDSIEYVLGWIDTFWKFNLKKQKKESISRKEEECKKIKENLKLLKENGVSKQEIILLLESHKYNHGLEVDHKRKENRILLKYLLKTVLESKEISTLIKMILLGGGVSLSEWLIKAVFRINLSHDDLNVLILFVVIEFIMISSLPFLSFYKILNEKKRFIIYLEKMIGLIYG